MSIAIELPKPRSVSPPPSEEPLVLENGAKMNREEFHRLYEQTPEDFRAELIEGVVYVASPLRRLHGARHFSLATLLGTYQFRTPGVEGANNCTVLLGDENEPQPDLFLRIMPEFGGQSRTTPDDYIEGAPELILEVALSSRSIDLNSKRHGYAKNGLKEYLVFVPAARKLYWFDLSSDQELPVPNDGVIKSFSFPGLWLSVPAIVENDFNQAMTILHTGLASPEHQAFVEQLAQRRAAEK